MWICPYAAGGNIGTEAIARGKPDGYTLGMGNFAPLAVNQALFKKLNFDPLNDLTPICLIKRGPLILMVRNDSPYRTVKQLNTVCNQALQTAEVKDKIQSQGNEVGGGTPEQFAALIRAEAPRWAKVVRDAKIDPE